MNLKIGPPLHDFPVVFSSSNQQNLKAYPNWFSQSVIHGQPLLVTLICKYYLTPCIPYVPAISAWQVWITTIAILPCLERHRHGTKKTASDLIVNASPPSTSFLPAFLSSVVPSRTLFHWLLLLFWWHWSKYAHHQQAKLQSSRGQDRTRMRTAIVHCFKVSTPPLHWSHWVGSVLCSVRPLIENVFICCCQGCGWSWCCFCYCCCCSWTGQE